MPKEYSNAKLIKAVLDADVPAADGRWVPLPKFEFSIDRPSNMDEKTMGQAFTSLLLRLFALAVNHVHANAKTPVEFITLCRIKTGAKKISFWGATPDPRIVSYIGGLIGSREKITQLFSTIESFQGKIKIQCGFPNDVPVPVVGVFTPDKQHFLFTNLNQLTAPAQFLDVNYCPRTSGFLNYVGTLIAQLSAQEGKTSKIEVTNIEHLLGKDMDPFIRWIHYAAASGGTIFDADRMFVNADDPERYDYRYAH